MSLDPLLQSTFAIQVHATSAMLATVLGAFVLFRRKGTRLHKLLGRVWVLLMVVTATSALFISENPLIGPFSPIHIFVVITFLGLWQGIRDIRRGRVAQHRANMQGVYLNALLLAGAFTLLPGRRMHDVLFGAESGWTPSLIAIPLALALVAFLWIRLWPRKVAAAG